MHTLVEVPVGTNGGTHVPAFLAKLWKIVDDSRTDDLISWTETGNSFTIKNQAKFARDLLPLYYKHNNMASFVRQLNMYGFHKVVSVEQGGLRVDKDEMEFAHPFFLKGQEASLELIKRKIPASKHEESRLRPDSFNKVLLDVRQMKGRQETMDNKLVTMKRENEALWRELASLRQKHAKQTQIVSKLLQFLVGMMSQQQPRLGFKRRMPLMLNDKEGLKQKLARTDTNESTGPVIHDVTELFEPDDYEETDQDHSIVQNMNSLTAAANLSGKIPFTETLGGRATPESPEVMLAINPTSISPTVVVPTTPQLQRPATINNQTKQAKPKAKFAAKKNQQMASTLAAVKSEPNVVSFQNDSNAFLAQQNITQPQLLQIPTMSSVPSQGQNNVPTTLYFSAPGMSEPVQVVLSIPDQNNTTIPSSSGMTSVTTPLIIPSNTTMSTVAANTINKPLSIQPQQQTIASTTNDLPVTTNGIDVNSTIGRNQSLNNPRILVKSNGSIVQQQDLDGHLDEMEMGINNLRDLFKGDDFQVDGDTLIGVSNSSSRPTYNSFNLAAIDPQMYTQLFDGSQNQQNVDNSENQANLLNTPNGDGNATGQEVVTYNPSLFELAGDDSNFFDESSNMFLDDELESMLTTDRDTLKRPDTRNPVSQTTFSGMNLNSNVYDFAGLNTPTSDMPLTPGTSTGSNKRRRK